MCITYPCMVNHVASYGMYMEYDLNSIFPLIGHDQGMRGKSCNYHPPLPSTPPPKSVFVYIILSKAYNYRTRSDIRLQCNFCGYILLLFQRQCKTSVHSDHVLVASSQEHYIKEGLGIRPRSHRLMIITRGYYAQ